MKRIAVIMVLAVLSAAPVFAQNALSEEEFRGVKPEVDSLLLGKTLREVMPACVRVNVSPAVQQAFDRIVRDNEEKMYSGFRVRIFQSSTQNAREASLAALNRFNAIFPDVPVYRSYSAPFFKVVAGGYRTKTDAEEALSAISQEFPGAVVVRDKFKYPAL